VNFRQLVREPLLHFLLIGVVLFLFYGHHAPGSGDDHTIVITQQLVDDLAQQFQLSWNRPATGSELRKIVDSYIQDEVLYREGMAAGLGREDAVIKRRVRQKIEVMAEEDSERAVSTDADLQGYLKAHPEKFARPAIVTFDQLYFGAAGPGTSAQIADAKAALLAGKDAATLGHPTMLPRRVEGQDIERVGRDFGAAFADTLATLPVGQWSGPVASGLGEHLVRVQAWTAAVAPPLAEIRPEVQREWENEHRQSTLDASYKKMRAKYDVQMQARLPPAQ
jgi:peptidyl-prolyl cis-trans isomerase C